MKRKLVMFLSLLVFGAIAYFYMQDNHDVKNMVNRYVENGDIQTLEARYSAEDIMKNNQKKLIGDSQRQYKEPIYKYQPYVLMDVKFIQDKKTKEGVALWSLMDGEMVLNADTFEKTHGFEDAINAKASKEEFKVINAIAKNNGSLSKDELISSLQLDADIIAPWLESAIDKHLVTRKGNQLQLHFENPKILVTPQTKFNQLLVSKPYNHSQRISQKYSISQIEKVAKAAFGSEFNIRRIAEVYLPIYQIRTENPDGSTTMTEWNAVTGQMISPNYTR